VRSGLRLWVPGVACLLGGLAGRIVLGWDGFPEGKLGYVRAAFWQLFWYGLGWLLIAAHLSRTAAKGDGPRASSWGRWSLWWVGVLVSGLAVLSSCPP
jgi:hypothetical protein